MPAIQAIIFMRDVLLGHQRDSSGFTVDEHLGAFGEVVHRVRVADDGRYARLAGKDREMRAAPIRSPRRFR